ncbi:MAG: thioredoxin domain-containing protein, partial [Candidatus Omnitrophica bacterium]|nr:thioredoxin domain-containing protein [Candidatus Omnitrophota bacterium]
YRIKGPQSAPIKIIEFIDFQCPACAHGSFYLKEMMEKHPDLIQLELKYFPLSMHAHALLSAKYVECAGQQGKFWEYQDQLLKLQNNWKKLQDAKPAFDHIAVNVEVNNPEFEACLASEDTVKKVSSFKDEGKTLGIKSTPTYFVNGEMIVGSNLLSQKLSELITKNQNE